VTAHRLLITADQAAACEEVGLELLANADPRASKLLVIALQYRGHEAADNFSRKVPDGLALRVIDGGEFAGRSEPGRESKRILETSAANERVARPEALDSSKEPA
jgi:hypothetical protein